MSLSSALNSATSALLVTQSSISVASGNVANAGTEGYTRKTVETDSVVLSGYGAGVTIGGISGGSDPFMLASIIEQSSESGKDAVIAESLDWLQQSLGTTSSESNITADLSTLALELEALAQTPESDSQSELVVSAAQDLAEELNSQSSTIQELRARADGDIEDRVEAINQSLSLIGQLNEEITALQAQGQSTLDLEDQRDQAMQELATRLDVSYFTTSGNQLYVYTASGQPLVDSQVHSLSYEAASGVGADTAYPGGFDAITLNGRDITSEIGGGELAGYIELRDEILPAQQEKIDDLAASLIDEINGIYSQGTAYPAPGEISGEESFAAGDAFSASGELRVALVDEAGELQGYQDFDLSSYATVGDLVTALDGLSGLSASLSSEGELVLSADDPDQGIALSQLDSAVGADGESFSSYFGLQHFFTGSGAGDIALADSLSSDPGSLATGRLDDSATLTLGDKVVTSGDGTLADDLATLLSGTSVVEIGGESTTYESFAADYLSGVAVAASEAETAAEASATVLETLQTDLSNATGVNIDEELAYIEQLENQYAAAAAVIETLQTLFNELRNMVN